MKKFKNLTEYAILDQGGRQVDTVYLDEEPIPPEGQTFREVHSWLRTDMGGWLVKGTSYSPSEYVDERTISPDQRPWRPFEEATPYRDGVDMSDELKEFGETFYANSHYLVFRRELRSTDPDQPPQIHLSMRTVENDARHDWREMQRVKNELAGPDWEAVELYPAESRVVDQANQYHLWCFAFRLPFGFDEGEKRATPEEAAAVGATQR